MYTSAKDVLELIGDSGKSIADIVIENEMELSELSRQEILDELQRRYDIMYSACHDGLEKAVISISGLSGGCGKQMWDFIQSGKGLQDLTTQKGIAYALSCSEVNASMGLIVAAPTAGACGILPGTLIAVAERLNSSKEDILLALATAAGVGQIVTKNATVSGAEGGCQAECGTASSMAAAAITQLCGGSPAQCFEAGAMAMKNVMGLVCDPVAGLVEMPCTKRNASGVTNAILCCDLAMAGITSHIPFDEVVDAMFRVGKALPSTLRETALGGVATTPTGLAMKEKIFGSAAQQKAAPCCGDCGSCGGCH